MNIFRYLRSSFSARLSLWVTGFVTAIFVVALTLLFHYSQAVVKDESLKQNQQVLEHAALRVDRILHQTEKTAETASWMIRQHLAQPAVVQGLCQEVLLLNTWIDSCYVMSADVQKIESACWQEPLVLNENFHEMPAEESKRIIQLMQDNAKKILRISRMLMIFASPRGHFALTKDTFSCNELCREIIGSFRLTNPYTVKLYFETTVPDDFMICTDKQRVKLILEELLDNANKFTHQGSIIVAVDLPDDKTMTITVSDTGIGIAEAHRQMIFSQFSKVDLFTEGVGLGLPLSKRAAKRIGGDLVLAPERKKGASFILTIPRQ